MSQQCDKTAKEANIILATKNRSVMSRTRGLELYCILCILSTLGWMPQSQNEGLNPKITLFKSNADKQEIPGRGMTTML